MPILNRAAEMQEEVTGWRRHIHQKPELVFDVLKTAEFVASKLKEFGCDEVVTGHRQDRRRRRHPGQSRRGRDDRPARRHGRAADQRDHRQALRLDRAGKMHACGHDGHTAMLLGAREVSRRDAQFRRHCRGHLPAGRRGRRRRQGDGQGRHDGALRHRAGLRHAQSARPAGRPVRHPARRHRWPPPTEFSITIKGRGGHAAMPQATIDPIVVATPDRHGAADDRLAQRRSGRIGGRLGDQVPCRRRLQRDPEHRGARRHGADAEARRCATLARERMEGSCEGIAQPTARRRRRLRAQLSGRPVNHPDETIFAIDVAATSPAQAQGRPDHAAGHGRRGLLLHAGGPARRVHLHRQWRAPRACITRPTTSTTRPSRSA